MPGPRRPLLLTQDDAQLLQNTPARNALLDNIKRLGYTGIQTDVQYGNVHRNGQWDFATSGLESLVDEARRRGIGVRQRLIGTPLYVENSRPDLDASLSATHPNPALMGQFAAATAAHFKGRVGGYSIGNEPNIGAFINLPPEQAARAYRSQYRAGYDAVKRFAPGAKVGFGELTSMQPGTTGAQSTVGFLRNVLKGNHALRADEFNLHPYQWSDPSTRPGNQEFGGISNLPAIQRELRDAQRRHQLTTPTGGVVPLGVSEFGYKHDVQADPRVRARWMQKAYGIARKAGVKDFNMYQLMPRQGAYWDTSIMNAQGQLDPAMAAALKRMRKGA